MFNNQRVIEAEARELQARGAACRARTRAGADVSSSAPQVQAQQFAKQTTRWINMVNDFDKALKARLARRALRHTRSRPAQEVGDFENWVKVMEWDMQAVATALEAAAAAGSPEKAQPEARR